MTRGAAHPSIRVAARWFGVGLFAFYLAWNIWWVSRAEVPPSLLKALTGLPAPTSGGTRSMAALVAGDLRTSIYFNPLTVPIVVLLAWTLLQVARYGSAKCWVGYAWVVLLLAGWLIKLASPVDTW